MGSRHFQKLDIVRYRASLYMWSLPFPSPFRGRLGRGLFLRSIVGLDGLRLNDYGRVGFLPVLAFGGDGSGHVARTQPQRNRYACHNRRGYGNNDFVKLLFARNNVTV